MSSSGMPKHDLAQADVMDRFHHIGEMEDTRAAFCLADLFLLCSRVDPFPSVVLEAFLHGVPVIGFDHWQGSADMIRGTKFGKIVPYLNLDTTVYAIDEILRGRGRPAPRSQKRSRISSARISNTLITLMQLARLILQEGPRKTG